MACTLLARYEFELSWRGVVQKEEGSPAICLDHQDGEFTTPSLRFIGNRASISLGTAVLGFGRVEIQDRSGPLASELERFRPHAHYYSTAETVRWREEAGAAGRDIPLRLELKYGTEPDSFRFSMCRFAANPFPPVLDRIPTGLPAGACPRNRYGPLPIGPPCVFSAGSD